MQVGTQHVTFQGLVADRRQDRERSDHRHLEPVGGEQLSDTGGNVVAVGVVNDDPPSWWPFTSAHLLWGEHVRQRRVRSEEHTSELQSRETIVCRLPLEKTKK